MKGSIGTDMLVKLGLGIIAIGVIIVVVVPLIYDAGAAAKSCGALRSLLSDLTAGGTQLC
ncbi:MAG: hypothetical protein ABEK16_03695 [Candidatus Nanohalobium sp.]